MKIIIVSVLRQKATMIPLIVDVANNLYTSVCIIYSDSQLMLLRSPQVYQKTMNYTSQTIDL